MIQNLQPGDLPPVSRRSRRRPQVTTKLKRSVRDFTDMFRERWWAGLIVGLVAATVIVLLRPTYEPIFRTEVSLLFEDRKDRVLNIQEVVDTSLKTAAELNTHMEQLRSRTFAAYVLSSFTPEETEMIQRPYLDPQQPNAAPPPLGAIVGPNVTIFAHRLTPILGIQVSNRSPEAAALIANRYARKYIDYSLDGASTRTNSAIVFLRNQANESRTQVESAESALQAYRARHNLAAIGESQSVVLQRMASLGTALVQAQLDQIDAKSLIDKIVQFQRDNRDLTEIPQILQSGAVAEERQRLITLLSERTMLDVHYLSAHPRILQNDLEVQEARRLLADSVSKAIADLRARDEVAGQYVERLLVERAGSEVQTHELDKITVHYKFLEQDAGAKRTTYTRIMDRLTEAHITSQMATANIAIFDPAWVPDTPADTGALDIALKAGGAALALLLVVPVGIGLLDTRLRTPAQLEESLQEPLLGVVKRMRRMGETERAQVFLREENRDLAEAYRGIYSEIEVRSTVAFPKALMVTSSVPAEGKSLLCCNLGAVFAAHQRRTLLVDCDLRRPTLHRYFKKPPGSGWVGWLQSSPNPPQQPPEGVVSLGEYLDLLPAGEGIHRSTELLEKLGRRETLELLLRNYDLVIFDTPPAAVFPDALMLARSCHEMIYVCRYRMIRAPVVRKVLDRFEEAGVSLLGLVLNQLPASHARRHGFQGYGTQAADYYDAYSKTKTP